MNNQIGHETCFYIQSRNTNNENRASGADTYEIEIYRQEMVVNEEGEEEEKKI
jgi:hypothetical protein